jgi:protein FRA10AC1
MRWRTMVEVKADKGDKICANVSCGRGGGLVGMEVVFGYFEDGKRRDVLVKCVLCEKCGRKMRKARGSSEKRRRRRKEHSDEEEDGKAKVKGDEEEPRKRRRRGDEHRKHHHHGNDDSDKRRRSHSKDEPEILRHT